MEPIVDIAIKNARAYAARHELLREQFGARWWTVQAVMGAFEDLGVHLVDVSPNNIAFLG